ncbi:uncharacterized protein [Physcomitrium patens]|uniref:Hexosyltransferase n=2 Tax=Physcomitrium patens TaxID=3218 RepID=A0A7I3YX01_PHYPA|nr:beta-1,3-galactosyltransferase 6-like isoform X1 [Physcomitrium patens]|eukprot:XP_024360392.1 beta-1,3-galactosyltransferase 6-like isoform X1 [Physcomitrella patens]
MFSMKSTKSLKLGLVGIVATLVTLLLVVAFLPPLLRSLVEYDVCDSVTTSAQTRAWMIQERETELRALMKGIATPTPHGPEFQNFSIFIGVFSTASKVERRNIIRLAYGIQHTNIANVSIRFVIGTPKGEEERLQLGLESLHYGDLLILDMEENMNKGKTWKYFSTVAIMGVHFDYVMKVDDDSYVRIHNLAASLAEQPRVDLYYGYVLPCENQNAYMNYIAGMGYILSWDLVQWIHESPIVRKRIGGYSEDRMTGDWLDAGNKALNRVNMKPMFYDHPAYKGRDRCSHELNPETILIHQLKSTALWLHVLRYFEGAHVTALSTPLRP